MIVNNRRVLSTYLFPQGAKLPFRARFIFPQYTWDDSFLQVYDNVGTPVQPHNIYTPLIEILFYIYDQPAFSITHYIWRVRPTIVELADKGFNYYTYYDLFSVFPQLQPQAPGAVGVLLDIAESLGAIDVTVRDSALDFTIVSRKSGLWVTTRKTILLGGMQNSEITRIQISTNNNIPEYNKPVGVIV